MPCSHWLKTINYQWLWIELRAKPMCNARSTLIMVQRPRYRYLTRTVQVELCVPHDPLHGYCYASHDDQDWRGCKAHLKLQSQHKYEAEDTLQQRLEKVNLLCVPYELQYTLSMAGLVEIKHDFTWGFESNFRPSTSILPSRITSATDVIRAVWNIWPQSR